MAAAIALRDDYDASRLREFAKRSEDADQTRRLLAVVYDGGSRSDGAKAGGVELRTFRDWVLRFNADGPAGLLNGKAPGQTPRLDAAQRQELVQVIEDGPRSQRSTAWCVGGCVSWCSGCMRGIASRSTSRRSAVIYGPWVIANCRHVPGTMRRTPRRWQRSKKLPPQGGRDRGARCSGQADRDLVPDAMKVDTMETDGCPTFCTGATRVLDHH